MPSASNVPIAAADQTSPFAPMPASDPSSAIVDLVNLEQEPLVRELAAGSTPEQTLRRMDAVGVARTRLAGNVAPLLAVEAMAIALRPQG